jgi:hypothetical protein
LVPHELTKLAVSVEVALELSGMIEEVFTLASSCAYSRDDTPRLLGSIIDAQARSNGPPDHPAELLFFCGLHVFDQPV